MNRYLEIEEAEQVMNTFPLLEYPDYEANIETYPLIPAQTKADGSVVRIADPSKLVVEAVPYLGQEPKRILDIGYATGLNSLYLAHLGHFVTALDISKDWLEYTESKADGLNIPKKNLSLRTGDVRDLTASDKYDAVIATMVLHFLPETDIKKTAGTIQDMTVKDGINVVSVFTDDNPDQELGEERQLNYLFRAGELSRLYMNGWHKIRDVEGYGDKYVYRGQIQNGAVLIPTIAELITRKIITTNPPANKTRSGLTSYRLPNGEIFYPVN